jgi:GTP-dependent phosphoenolpyruvate carboxykinase
MDGFDAPKLAKVQEINLEEWRNETQAGQELAFKLRADTPKELVCERELLLSRL